MQAHRGDRIGRDVTLAGDPPAEDLEAADGGADAHGLAGAAEPGDPGADLVGFARPQHRHERGDALEAIGCGAIERRMRLSDNVRFAPRCFGDCRHQRPVAGNQPCRGGQRPVGIRRDPPGPTCDSDGGPSEILDGYGQPPSLQHGAGVRRLPGGDQPDLDQGRCDARTADSQDLAGGREVSGQHARPCLSTGDDRSVIDGQPKAP